MDELNDWIEGMSNLVQDKRIILKRKARSAWKLNPAVPLMKVLFILAILSYVIQITDAAVVILVPDSSMENNGSKQMATGKNKYATFLQLSQTEIPPIYLNRSELDSLSARDSVYAMTAGNKKQDSYLSVNFTLPGVNSVNWLKIRSIAYVSGDMKDAVHLGLWNDTSPAGGGWNGLNYTEIKCPFVNLTYNVTVTDEITKYTMIDADKNLNFSMALWTNGVHSSNISVDLFEAIIDYDPASTTRFINGTVLDSDTRAGIEGVTVSDDTGIYAVTNESGYYSMAVASGIYNLTAVLEPVYYKNSSITVSTELDDVVVLDIELVKKPTGTITGSVNDAREYEKEKITANGRTNAFFSIT